MRILITGITGLLGTALQSAVSTAHELFGTYYPERLLPLPLQAAVRAANVADPAQMTSVFEWARPDVVIHTAAIGSVDFAEKNTAETRMVNVGGTQVVTDFCCAINARLIYISSNAVFDGQTPPYAETAPVNPINQYGRLKVESERIVESSGLTWAIVRPILMYGWSYPGERDNPVTFWLRALRQGNPIKVVDNVYSKPLYPKSCAEAIWAIIHQKRQGIFHAAGRDHLSLYDFALTSAEVFGLDQNLITPVPDSYFPELAPRPRDTSFVTDKMEFDLGVIPLTVCEGLSRMKDAEGAVHKGSTLAMSNDI